MGPWPRCDRNYELGQADLGAIDPASESMRLATLGLRGVAVSILCQRAEYYKREQFWDNYSATLNQITRLEPHFVKVWDFLSWNLSYNISVEFDDFSQRYAWVKKGIDYLLVGTKYNRRKTDLPYELGWKFGNKFGVSDEKVQSVSSIAPMPIGTKSCRRKRKTSMFCKATLLGPDNCPTVG